MHLDWSHLKLDARIAAAATPGYPVVTRPRLRRCGVHRDRVAERLRGGGLTAAWGDTMLVGAHDLTTVPRDLLRRAAVASVEPVSALGGVSAIERMTGWDRFDRDILVVADRWHANVPEHRIRYRRVDVDREFEGVRELEGIPTTAALPSLLHAARDLTPHQIANAFQALQYREGLQLQQVWSALVDRDRVIGAPRLRRAMELVHAGSAGTKSRSEDVMLPLVTARYGEPLVNVRGCAGIADYEPDLCWPLRRWIVEIDGRHHLDDPAVVAADRARDELLRAAGWTVVRIPWWWAWHRRDHALRVIARAFGA